MNGTWDEGAAYEVPALVWVKDSRTYVLRLVLRADSAVRWAVEARLIRWRSGNRMGARQPWNPVGFALGVPESKRHTDPRVCRDEAVAWLSGEILRGTFKAEEP